MCGALGLLARSRWRSRLKLTLVWMLMFFLAGGIFVKKKVNE